MNEIDIDELDRNNVNGWHSGTISGVRINGVDVYNISSFNLAAIGYFPFDGTEDFLEISSENINWKKEGF